MEGGAIFVLLLFCLFHAVVHSELQPLLATATTSVGYKTQITTNIDRTFYINTYMQSSFTMRTYTSYTYNKVLRNTQNTLIVCLQNKPKPQKCLVIPQLFPQYEPCGHQLQIVDVLFAFAYIIACAPS